METAITPSECMGCIRTLRRVPEFDCSFTKHMRDLALASMATLAAASAVLLNCFSAPTNDAAFAPPTRFVNGADPPRITLCSTGVKLKSGLRPVDVWPAAASLSSGGAVDGAKQQWSNGNTASDTGGGLLDRSSDVVCGYGHEPTEG